MSENRARGMVAAAEAAVTDSLLWQPENDQLVIIVNSDDGLRMTTRGIFGTTDAAAELLEHVAGTLRTAGHP